MFVRDRMTRNPVVVRPESDPVAALQILNAARFHHLPVVDAGGRLAGIVTRADLELFLSRAGSPSILQRQHRIEQAMVRDVVTVSPGCPLEDAATLMVQRRIACLPVLEDERVVGIITGTDILKQLAAALGGGTAALRLTVQVPDVPGQLAALAVCLARANVNVNSIVGYAAATPGRQNITMRVTGADRQAVLDAITCLADLELVDVAKGTAT